MVSLQALTLMVALSSAGQVPGVGETVLLDFTADWCGPCQTMRPTVERLAGAGHPVRVVNIDQNRTLAAKHRVTNIPCFVMLVNGQEVDRAAGVVDQSRLEQMLARGAQAVQAPGPAIRAFGQSPDDGHFANTLPAEATNTTVMSEHRPWAMPGAAPRGGDLSQRLLQSTVRLKIEDPNGNSFGTGTIIDARKDEALVLTCGHIFRDSGGKGKISVELFTDGAARQVEGRLVSYELKRDLGLVSIRPGAAVQVARVAPKGHSIAVGDRVSSVGCDHGKDPTVNTSRVTAIDKYLGPPNLEVAGMPVEGRSGGGLFDDAGNLIGVCFAADPADNEGVYSHLLSIQAELDRLNLQTVYQQQPASDETPEVRLASTTPEMPRQMPHDNFQPAAGEVVALAGRDAAENEDSLTHLNAKERATLEELRRRSRDAEVICIIRPLSDPNAKSEVIVLDRVSSEFLEQLSGRRQPAEGRRLTSHAEPAIELKAMR